MTLPELYNFLDGRLKINTLQKYARTGKINASDRGDGKRATYIVSLREATRVKQALDNGTWPKPGNPNPTGRRPLPPDRRKTPKRGVLHLPVTQDEAKLLAQTLDPFERLEALYFFALCKDALQDGWDLGFTIEYPLAWNDNGKTERMQALRDLLGGAND